MNKQLKYILVSILELLVACLATETVTAQIVDSGYVLFLKTQRLQSYPPLSKGMPFEVRIGYMYLDSLRKQDDNSIKSFIDAMGDSDTLRQALKYLYKMDDYDPITFMNYLRTSPAPRTRYYQSSGDAIRNRILWHAGHLLPDTERTEMICYADIIARIVITSVESRYDSMRGSVFPNQVIVSSQVIDTIKGRVLPSCSNGTRAQRKSATSLTLENCLPFCYSPQESLKGSSGDAVMRFGHDNMTDSLGNPLVKVGDEYIAFLSLYLVGGDSLSIYYTVDLPKAHTTQGSLYRIIDGHVSDPNNDLGFGIYPTTAVFVAGLRSKIYSITHP